MNIDREDLVSAEGVKTKVVGSWIEGLEFLMSLRSSGFWSFRGQRDHSWPLGIHHPPGTTNSDLKRGFNQFRKRCLEFNQPPYIKERQTWRWLFFAQHYRLRTRLLDWTSNPLVAMYFAVENILTDKEVLARNPVGAVWAVKVRPEDFRTEEQLARKPSRVTRWIMINPPPVTSRLLKQASKFSFHPKQDQDQLNLRPRRRGEELWKITLGDPSGSTKDLSEDIREKLGVMNVHHASLFPDPEGVALFINEQWPSITTQFP